MSSIEKKPQIKNHNPQTSSISLVISKFPQLDIHLFN